MILARPTWASPDALGRSRLTDLAPFVATTFLISWAAFVPAALAAQGVIATSVPPVLLVVAGFGPGLAAIAISARAGEARRLASMLTWRAPIATYAVAVGLPLVLVFASAAIADIEWSTAPALEGASLPGAVIAAVFAGQLFTIFEELGWRGYAQDRLGKIAGWRRGALVVGLLWATWHLPLLIAGAAPVTSLPWFIADIIASSLIVAWLFERSKHSLVPVTLLHAVNNSAALLGPAALFADAYPVLVALRGAVAVLVAIAGGSESPRQRPSALDRRTQHHTKGSA